MTVVDQKNELGAIFGYRAIPNGFFVDESGRLMWQEHGGFSIHKDATVKAVRTFVQTGETPDVEGKADLAASDGHFRRGQKLFEDGDLEAAAAVWREGISVDPTHWNMRKQLWAIEHPERFYDGEVDYEWQREQIEAGG